jgi:hypothetical protein
MGSALNGFYGIGLSLMILPFIMSYEFKNCITSKIFYRITLISGFIIFIYFWSMLVGIDPAEYRGLTQRLASVVIFGWLSFAAFHIDKIIFSKSSL